MSLAPFVYGITGISILVIGLQPQVSQYIELKKTHRELFAKSQDIITRRKMEVNKFNFYKGKTALLYQRLNTSLTDLNNLLEKQSKSYFSKWKLYSSVQKLQYIESELKKVEKDYQDLKKKTEEVYEFLSELKLKLIDQHDEETHKQYNLIESTLETDVLEAHFIMSHLTKGKRTSSPKNNKRGRNQSTQEWLESLLNN